MSTVNVVKAFTLTFIREGHMVKQRIEAGIQKLEQDVADHWYTLAHSEPMPKGAEPTEKAGAKASAKK